MLAYVAVAVCVYLIGLTVKFRWGSKKLRKNSFESVYKEWYTGLSRYYSDLLLDLKVCASLQRYRLYG